MTAFAHAPDQSLVAAFAAGDAQAGDALFARHALALRAFLTARCRDAELAAELLQEVALKFVTVRTHLDPDRDVRAYLFQVAANVWRDHVRKDLVRERAQHRLGLAGHGPPAPATDQRLLTRELQAAVRRAVAALPAAQREVLELRQAGLPFRVIAERLERPLGTVLGQMHAALGKIDAALEDYR